MLYHLPLFCQECENCCQILLLKPVWSIASNHRSILYTVCCITRRIAEEKSSGVRRTGRMEGEQSSVNIGLRIRRERKILSSQYSPRLQEQLPTAKCSHRIVQSPCSMQQGRATWGPGEQSIALHAAPGQCEALQNSWGSHRLHSNAGDGRRPGQVWGKGRKERSYQVIIN